MSPKRIQRQRTKGWRMPEGAVYVGRPTKHGNHYRVGEAHPVHGWPMSAVEAVEAYRRTFQEEPFNEALRSRAVRELRGKDLACWCPLDQPCHADVLLELANSAREEPPQ